MLMETPAVRLIARMDIPSTSIERIITRLAVGSLFIVNNFTFFRSNVKSNDLMTRPGKRVDLLLRWAVISPHAFAEDISHD